MVLAWPSLMPAMQRAGNGRAPVDLSARSNMAQGALQARERFERPRETCPITFLVDDNGLAFWDAYWHTTLGQGCAWVAMPLKGELGTATTYARFPGGYKATQVSPKWRIETVAELEGVPHLNALLPTTQVPVFSPTPGLLSGSAAVEISCATPNCLIFYTTDGTTPTRSSTVYAGSINVPFPTSVTFKAFAIATGLEDSQVAIGNYYFGAVNVPVVNPADIWAVDGQILTRVRPRVITGYVIT